MISNKSLPMPITVRPYHHQQQAFDFACMRFGLLPSDFRSNGVALRVVLLTEAQALTEEKEHLVFSVNREMKKTEKLADLIRFCSRDEMLTEFDGDCFTKYVERDVIYERITAAFELKCGLILKGRIR